MTYDGDKGPDLYQPLGMEDAPWPVRQAFRFRTLVVGSAIVGAVLWWKGLPPW